MYSVNVLNIRIYGFLEEVFLRFPTHKLWDIAECPNASVSRRIAAISVLGGRHETVEDLRNFAYHLHEIKSDITRSGECSDDLRRVLTDEIYFATEQADDLEYYQSVSPAVYYGARR